VAGKSIVMNDSCPGIRGKLESLDFKMFVTPLDECIKGGGNAKCLTLMIV
jgi:N-dimethylarginine dimethylaminohydrolase